MSYNQHRPDPWIRYAIGNDESVWICPLCEPPEGAEYLETSRRGENICDACDTSQDETDDDTDDTNEEEV